MSERVTLFVQTNPNNKNEHWIDVEFRGLRSSHIAKDSNEAIEIVSELIKLPEGKFSQGLPQPKK